MSSNCYENIQAVLDSQLELTKLLQSLRRGFSKAFKNDALTIMIDADGEKHPVYDIIRTKLQKIRELKTSLPPQAVSMLNMMLGEGTRFAEWLAKQPLDYILEIIEIQHDIVVPVESTLSHALDWQAAVNRYQSVHHQYYITLKKIGLYLERLQQSTNISARDKDLLSVYAAHFDKLSQKLAKLGLDELNTTTVDAFCRGFSECFHSALFENYLQAIHDLSEKIKTEALPLIETILRRNERFHWHMGPNEAASAKDFIDCLQLLTNMRNPLYELSAAMETIVPAVWSEAKKYIVFNHNVLHGQDLVQAKIRDEDDDLNLIDFILSVDTEYPCPSWGKRAGRSAAVRAGMIEEVLLLAFPEECQRSLETAFSIRHIDPLYLGQSATFGRINPQELIGSEFLDKSKKGILFSILAAIAPIQDKKIGSHFYAFTPTQKLKAYTQLIQAIDDRRLKISEESPLEQKRKLAERVLYLMVKYHLPADNPDFQDVYSRIQSKSGVKAMKSLSRHLGYKEDVDLTQGKTIQKLFREWSTGTPILLKDLRARIHHPEDYSSFSTPPLPKTPLGGAGGPAAMSSSALKPGFFDHKDKETKDQSSLPEESKKRSEAK